MKGKRLSIRSTPAEVKPIFADEVMVSFSLKGEEKQAVIRLSFIDLMRQQVVAEVVIAEPTFEAMRKVFENVRKKIDEIRKGKGKKVEESEDLAYIG